MKICGVISAKNINELITAALRSKARIVELRIDTLSEELHGAIRDLGSLIEELTGKGKKTIVTLRDESEGGYFNGTPAEKAQLLLRLAEYGPHYIDVELSNRAFEQIAHSIISTGISLIVSYHDLSKPLTHEQIHEIVNKTVGVVQELASDYRLVVKIVYRCLRPVDELDAMKAVASFEGRLVSFAVGNECILSRIAAPLLGAPFTYAYEHGGPIVPGQPSVDEVIKIWRLLGAA